MQHPFPHLGKEWGVTPVLSGQSDWVLTPTRDGYWHSWWRQGGWVWPQLRVPPPANPGGGGEISILATAGGFEGPEGAPRLLLPSLPAAESPSFPQLNLIFNYIFSPVEKKQKAGWERL